MIHVIASISITPSRMGDALKVYERFVPKVTEEEGCIMYQPHVDYDTDIATQRKEENVITVIEQWKDEAAFLAHLSAPHVIAFREEMKGILEKVSIKVLQQVRW